MALYDLKGNTIETGAKSYAELTGKPKVNGIELSGDKSSADLNIPTPTAEQVDTAVSAWLDTHPEATTTVQDNAVDYSKLAMLECVTDVVNFDVTTAKAKNQIYYYYGESKDSIDESKVGTFKGGNYEYKYLDCRGIDILKCRVYRTSTVYQTIFITAYSSFAESVYSSNPTEAPNKAYCLKKITPSEIQIGTEYDIEIPIDKEFPYITIGFAQGGTTASDAALHTIVDGWYVNSASSPVWHLKMYTTEGETVRFNDDAFPKAIGQASKSYFEQTETNIYIAASDSTEGDKARATLVCSGTNDEQVIQNALDMLSKTGGVITLFNGNYYFDGFTEIDGVGKFCTYVLPNNYQRHIVITGTNSPIRKYGGKLAVGSAIINITSDALDMVDGTEVQACVFGLASTTHRDSYPAYSFEIHRIGFNFKDNQHKVICINGEMFSAMKASDLQFTIDVSGDTDDTSGYLLPKEGFIALRGLVSGNYGSGFLLSNMFAFGFDCAYDLGGEHLIATQLGCRFCNYSFRFNHYGPSGLHPMTLINCCDEGCIHAPYFSGNAGNKSTQSISFYEYNEEVHTTGTFAQQTKAFIDEGQKFNGIVTYSLTSATTWKKLDTAFFEDGCGEHYKAINMPYIGAE